MAWLRALLDTPEAQEALGAGLVKLVKTGDLAQGIDEMISRGKKNGSWPLAKLFFIFDLFA